METIATINETKLIAATIYWLPKTSASIPVKCRAAADNAAMNRKTVCILCIISANRAQK